MGNFEDWFFKGYLDEIRLWSVARTQAEILQNISHHLRGDEPGLAAYWNFNEGEGQVFHDMTTSMTPTVTWGACLRRQSRSNLGAVDSAARHHGNGAGRARRLAGRIPNAYKTTPTHSMARR